MSILPNNRYQKVVPKSTELPPEAKAQLVARLNTVTWSAVPQKAQGWVQQMLGYFPLFREPKGATEGFQTVSFYDVFHNLLNIPVPSAQSPNTFVPANVETTLVDAQRCMTLVLNTFKQRYDDWTRPMISNFVVYRGYTDRVQNTSMTVRYFITGFNVSTHRLQIRYTTAPRTPTSEWITVPLLGAGIPGTPNLTKLRSHTIDGLISAVFYEVIVEILDASNTVLESTDTPIGRAVPKHGALDAYFSEEYTRHLNQIRDTSSIAEVMSLRPRIESLLELFIGTISFETRQYISFIRDLININASLTAAQQVDLYRFRSSNILANTQTSVIFPASGSQPTLYPYFLRHLYLDPVVDVANVDSGTYIYFEPILPEAFPDTRITTNVIFDGVVRVRVGNIAQNDANVAFVSPSVNDFTNRVRLQVPNVGGSGGFFTNRPFPWRMLSRSYFLSWVMPGSNTTVANTGNIPIGVGLSTTSTIDKLMLSRSSIGSFQNLTSPFTNTIIPFLNVGFRNFDQGISSIITSSLNLTVSVPTVGNNPGIGALQLYTRRSLHRYNQLNFLYNEYKTAYEDIVDKYGNPTVSAQQLTATTTFVERPDILAPVNTFTMPALTVVLDSVPSNLVTDIVVTPTFSSAAIRFNIASLSAGRAAGIWLDYRMSSNPSWTSMFVGRFTGTSQSTSVQILGLTGSTPYIYRMGVQINDSIQVFFPSGTGAGFTTPAQELQNPITGFSVSSTTPTTIGFTYTISTLGADLSLRLKTTTGGTDSFLTSISGGSGLLSGLNPGTTYTLTLEVVDSSNTVRYSSTTITSQTPANPITFGTFTVPTTTSIQAPYTLALQAGAPTLTHRIGYRTSASGSFTYPQDVSSSAANMSYTPVLNNLNAGTAYTICVELLDNANNVYAALVSSPVSTPANPITTFNVSQGTTPTTLSVSFTAPISGTQICQLRVGSNAPIDISSASSPYTLTGLTPNTTYILTLEILTGAGGSVYSSSASLSVTTAASSILSLNTTVVRSTEAIFSYGVTAGSSTTFTVSPSNGVTNTIGPDGVLRLTGLVAGTTYTVTLNSSNGNVISTQNVGITTRSPDVWKAIGDFVSRYNTVSSQISSVDISVPALADLSGAIEGLSTTYRTSGSFDPTSADNIGTSNLPSVTNRYINAMSQLNQVVIKVVPFRNALIAFRNAYTPTQITGLPQTVVLSAAVAALSTYYTSSTLNNSVVTMNALDDTVTKPDYVRALADYTFLTDTITPFRLSVITFGDKYYNNLASVTIVNASTYPNLRSAIDLLGKSVSGTGGETAPLYSNTQPRVFKVYTSVFGSFDFTNTTRVFQNGFLELNQYVLESAYTTFNTLYSQSTEGVPNSTLISDSYNRRNAQGVFTYPDLVRTVGGVADDVTGNLYTKYGAGAFSIPFGTTDSDVVTDTAILSRAISNINALIQQITSDSGSLQTKIVNFFNVYDSYSFSASIPGLASNTTAVIGMRNTFYIDTGGVLVFSENKLRTFVSNRDENAAITAFDNALADLNDKVNGYVDQQLQTSATAFRTAYAVNTLQGVSNATYIQKFKDSMSSYYTSTLSNSVSLLTTYFPTGASYTLPSSQAGSNQVGTKWTNRNTFIQATQDAGTFITAITVDIEAFKAAIGAFYDTYDGTTADQRSFGYMDTNNTITGALAKRTSYYTSSGSTQSLSDGLVYAWASNSGNDMVNEKTAFQTATSAVQTAVAYSATMMRLQNAYSTFWVAYTGSIEGVRCVELISPKTGDKDYPSAAISLLGTYGPSGTFMVPTTKPTSDQVSEDTTRFRNGEASLTKSDGLFARIRAQGAALQSAVKEFVDRYTPLAQNAKDGITYTADMRAVLAKISTYYVGYPTNTTTISTNAVYTTVAGASSTDITGDTLLFGNSKTDLDNAVANFVATLANAHAAFRTSYNTSTGGVINSELIADATKTAVLQSAIALLRNSFYGNEHTLRTPTDNRGETQRIADIQTFTQGLVDLRALVGNVVTNAGDLETAVRGFSGRYMSLSPTIKDGIPSVLYTGKDYTKISTAIAKKSTYFTDDTYKSDPNPAYAFSSTGNEIAERQIFVDGLAELEKAVTAYVDSDLQTKYNGFKALYLGFTGDSINITLLENQQNNGLYPSAAILLLETYRTSVSDYTFRMPVGRTESQKIADAATFDTGKTNMSNLLSNILDVRSNDLSGAVVAFFTKYDGYPTAVTSALTATSNIKTAIEMRSSFYDAAGTFSPSLLSRFVSTKDEQSAKVTFEAALADLGTAARAYIVSQLGAVYTAFRSTYNAEQSGITNAKLISDSLPIGKTNATNLRAVRSSLLDIYGNGAAASIPTDRSDADVWADTAVFATAKTELEALVGPILRGASDLSGAVVNFFERYDDSDIVDIGNTLTQSGDTLWAAGQRNTFYRDNIFSPSNLYTFVSGADEDVTKSRFEQALRDLNVSVRNKRIADLSGVVSTFVGKYRLYKDALSGLPTSSSASFSAAVQITDTRQLSVGDSANFGSYVETLTTDQSIQEATNTFTTAGTYLDRLVGVLVPLKNAAELFKDGYEDIVSAGLPENSDFTSAKNLLTSYFGPTDAPTPFSVVMTTPDTTFNADKMRFLGGQVFRSKMISVEAIALRSAIKAFYERYTADEKATRIMAFTRTPNLSGAVEDLKTFQTGTGELFGSGFATYISANPTTAYSSKQSQHVAALRDLNDLLVRKAISDFAQVYSPAVATTLDSLVPADSLLDNVIRNMGIYWNVGSGAVTPAYLSYVGGVSITNTMLAALEAQFMGGLVELRTYVRSAPLQRSILAFNKAFSPSNLTSIDILSKAQTETITNSVRDLETSYVNGVFTPAFYTYVNLTTTTDEVLVTKKAQFDNDVLRIKTMLAMSTFKRVYVLVERGLAGDAKTRAESQNGEVTGETLGAPTSSLQVKYEGYAVETAEALRATVRGTVEAFRGICQANPSLLTSSLQAIYGPSGQAAEADYTTLTMPVRTYTDITDTMESDLRTLVPRYMGAADVDGAYTELFGRVLADKRTKASDAIEDFHFNTWILLLGRYGSGQTAFVMTEGDVGYADITKANKDKVDLRGAAVNSDTTAFTALTFVELESIQTQFKTATKALVLLLINKFRGIQTQRITNPQLIVRPSEGIASDVRDAETGGSDMVRVRNAYIGTPPGQGVQNYWDQLIVSNNAMNRTTTQSTAFTAMLQFQGLYEEFVGLLKDVHGAAYTNADYTALTTTYLDVSTTPATPKAAFTGLTEVQFVSDITDRYSRVSGAAYSALLAEARAAMRKRISSTRPLESGKLSYMTRYAVFSSIRPETGITIPKRIADNNPDDDVNSVTDSINATELAVIRQEYYGEPTVGSTSGYIGHIAALETLITETERENRLQAAEVAIKRFYRDTYVLTEKYSVPYDNPVITTCITNSALYLDVGAAYTRKPEFAALSDADLDSVKSQMGSGFRQLSEAVVRHFVATYADVSDVARIPIIAVDPQVTNKILSLSNGPTEDIRVTQNGTQAFVEGVRNTYLTASTGLWALLHTAVVSQVKTHAERFEAVLLKANALGFTSRAFTGRSVSTAVQEMLTTAELAQIYREYAQPTTGHSVLLLSDIQAAFTGPTGYEVKYGNLYNAYDAFQKDVAVQTVGTDLAPLPSSDLSAPTKTTYTLGNLIGHVIGAKTFSEQIQTNYDLYVGNVGRQIVGRLPVLLQFTKDQLDKYVGNFETLRSADLERVTNGSDYVAITTSESDTIQTRMDQLEQARANAARLGMNQLRLNVLNTIEMFNTALYSNNASYISLPTSDTSEGASRIRALLATAGADSVSLTSDTATDVAGLANMRSKYIQASVDLLAYILNGLEGAYSDLESLYSTYATFTKNDKVRAVFQLADISDTSSNTLAQQKAALASLRSTSPSSFSNTTVTSVDSLRNTLATNVGQAEVTAQLHAYIQAFKRVFDSKGSGYREPYSSYTADMSETLPASDTPTASRLVELLTIYTTYTSNLDITDGKMAAILPLSEFYIDLYTAHVTLLMDIQLSGISLPVGAPLPAGVTHTLQSAVDNAPLISVRLPSGVPNEIKSTTELNAIQSYYTAAGAVLLPIVRDQAQTTLTTYIRLRDAFDTCVDKEAVTPAPESLPSKGDAETLRGELVDTALAFTSLSPFLSLAKNYPAYLTTLYEHVKAQLTVFISRFYTEFSKQPSPRTLSTRLTYTSALRDSDLSKTSPVSTISYNDLIDMLDTYITLNGALRLARIQEITLVSIDGFTNLYDTNVQLLNAEQTTFNGLTREQATTDAEFIQTSDAEAASNDWLSTKKAAYEAATTALFGVLKTKLISDISGFVDLYTVYDGLDRSAFESDLAPTAAGSPIIASGLANVSEFTRSSGADDLVSLQAISTDNRSVGPISAFNALRDRYYGTPQTKGALESLVVHVKANLARYIQDYQARYKALLNDTTEGGRALTSGQTSASQFRSGLVDDLADSAKLSAIGQTDALGAYTMSSVADMNTLISIINAYIDETPDLREAMRIHAHKKTTLARIDLFETTRTTEFRQKVVPLPTISGYTYGAAERTTDQAVIDRDTVKNTTTFASVDGIYKVYGDHMANLALDAMAVFNKLYLDTATLSAFFSGAENNKAYNAFMDTYSADSVSVNTNTPTRNAEIVREYVGYSVFIESKKESAQVTFQTVAELKQTTLNLIAQFAEERASALQVLSVIGVAASTFSVETREADTTRATQSVTAAQQIEQVTPIQTSYQSHLNEVRSVLRTKAVQELVRFQDMFNEWVAYKDTWLNTDLVAAGTRSGTKSPAEERRSSLEADVTNAEGVATLGQTLTTYTSYISTMRAFMAPPNGTTFQALKMAVEPKIEQLSRLLSAVTMAGLSSSLTDTSAADKAELTSVSNILAVHDEYFRKSATLLQDVRAPTRAVVDAFKAAYERDVSGVLTTKIIVDVRVGYENLINPVSNLTASAPRLYTFLTNTATVEDTLAVYTVYKDLLDVLPFEVTRAETLLLIEALDDTVVRISSSVGEPQKTSMLSGIPTVASIQQARKHVQGVTTLFGLNEVKVPYAAAIAEVRNRIAVHVGSTITSYEEAYEEADTGAFLQLFTITQAPILASLYFDITRERSELPTKSIVELLTTLTTYTGALSTLKAEVEAANATVAFNALKGDVNGAIDQYSLYFSTASTIAGLTTTDVTSTARAASDRADIQSASISTDTLQSMKHRYQVNSATLVARVKARAIEALTTYNSKFTDQRAQQVAFTPVMEGALSSLASTMERVNRDEMSMLQMRDLINHYVSLTSDVLTLLPESVLVPQNRTETGDVLLGFQTRLLEAIPYALQFSNDVIAADPTKDMETLATLTVNSDITALKNRYKQLNTEIDAKVAVAGAIINQQKTDIAAQANSYAQSLQREYEGLADDVKKEYPQLATVVATIPKDVAILTVDLQQASVATLTAIATSYSSALDVLRYGRQAYEADLLTSKRQSTLALLDGFSKLFAENITFQRFFTDTVQRANSDIQQVVSTIQKAETRITELDAIQTRFQAALDDLRVQIRRIQTANITEAIRAIRRFKILYEGLSPAGVATLPEGMRVSAATVLRDMDILDGENVSSDEIRGVLTRYTEYVSVLEKATPATGDSDATLDARRKQVIASIRDFNDAFIKNSYKVSSPPSNVLRRLRTIPTDLEYVQQSGVTSTELVGIQQDYTAAQKELMEAITQAARQQLPPDVKSEAVQAILTRFVDMYSKTDHSTLSLSNVNFVKLLFENQNNVYVYKNTAEAVDAYTHGLDILTRAPVSVKPMEPPANPEYERLKTIIQTFLREFPLRTLGRAISTDRLLLSELKRNSGVYLKMYEVPDLQQRNYAVLMERLADQYHEGIRLLRTYPLK